MSPAKLVCYGLIMMVAVVISCEGASADDSLERARREGVTYAFSNEPPTAYLGPDGKPAGFTTQLLLDVFARIGITNVKPVQTEWASLIPGLKVGRFDVLQPMFILPARCQEVGFAEPVMRTGSAFLVRKGNPKGLHSYADVAKNSNAAIAVMAGAAEDGFARRAGIPNDRIVPLQDPGAMLSAIKAGRADAAALTPASISTMAEKGGDDVEVAKPFETPTWAIKYIAPPFRKDATALREAFNQAFKEYVKSARYAELLARSPGRESPGDMAAQQQCDDK